MEKVENPYRTARVQKVSIDTSGHVGSRLSGHACAMRTAGSMTGDGRDAIGIRRRMRVSCRPRHADFAADPRRNVLGAILAGPRLIRSLAACEPAVKIGTEYEEFYRGIIRLLRRQNGYPRSPAKVHAFGAKLLAMQRAPL